VRCSCIPYCRYLWGLTCVVSSIENFDPEFAFRDGIEKIRFENDRDVTREHPTDFDHHGCRDDELATSLVEQSGAGFVVVAGINAIRVFRGYSPLRHDFGHEWLDDHAKDFRSQRLAMPRIRAAG
jgi:hypothetical protein